MFSFATKNQCGGRRAWLSLTLAGLGLAMTVCLTSFFTTARADDAALLDSWYFTAEEVAAAYQYQLHFGERLHAPLRAGNCSFSDGEFPAIHRRTEFPVPCRFIAEVRRHLKEMLAAGAARYLFALDADHAHLGVPSALWNEKYKHLPAQEVFPAMVRDPALVALYHTAEHLRITDRKTGAVNEQAKAWLEKRNVLGSFDGRPIQILAPKSGGHGVAMPEAYYAYGGFTFLASPRGELFLSQNQKYVTFDVAFDANLYDYAEEQDPNYGGKSLIRTSR